MSQINQQLDQLIEALDQSAPQWDKANRDLEAATEFYEMIDPNKPSSEGISEFVAGLEPHLDNDDESMLLRKLLRRIDGLEEFHDEYREPVFDDLLNSRGEFHATFQTRKLDLGWPRYLYLC